MQLCGFNVGLTQRFFLIAGTCSIEGLQMSLDVAGQLKEVCTALGIPLIYKGSFDKANRSSGTSKRGVGLDAGLKILDEVRRQLQLPILTDVHDTSHVAEVASVVDVLQTPAFLCRQTDFIRAVAQSGKPVNIKKGQFLAPWDMKNVIDKARAAAAEVGLSEDRFLACERGVSFGYNNLVADMTSLAEMRNSGAPVVFDVTHSVHVIASVTVTNPTQYEEYRKWSTLAMQAHGAEVCVRGGKVEVLEGDWNPGRTVILKFPSFDAARAFYDTPEYQKAKAAREGAAVMRMVCVEGV